MFAEVEAGELAVTLVPAPTARAEEEAAREKSAKVMGAIIVEN